MWHAAVRDLVWRWRRYAISVVGTSLVFAVGLAVTGVSDYFPVELDRTFESLRASAFIVPEGISGPLTGAEPFDPGRLPDGVDPMAYLIQTANPDDPEMVAVLGLEPGDAEPEVAEGSQLTAPDQALVDDASSFRTGSDMEIAGRSFRVVGRVEHLSVNAGMPMVVIPLDAFQETILGGLPLVTAGIARDGSAPTPDGFRTVGLAEAREDALRILGDAAATIDLVKVLLWVVAALIVGSVMYLSAIERMRDFALFRAIGVATGPIAGGLALQAAVLSLMSALLGEVLAFLLVPIFPMEVLLSTQALVGFPAIALAVGLLAGSFALRRALSVEPALAFGGAT